MEDPGGQGHYKPDGPRHFPGSINFLQVFRPYIAAFLWVPHAMFLLAWVWEAIGEGVWLIGIVVRIWVRTGIALIRLPADHRYEYGGNNRRIYLLESSVSSIRTACLKATMTMDEQD